MPHSRPRTNASPQITSADPRIRIPAWRSASPKNWKTRPSRTSPTTRAANRASSPKEAIQSRGTPSQDSPIRLPSGSRERGQAELGEEEEPDRQEDEGRGRRE